MDFDLLLIEAKRYNYNTFRSLLKWPGQKEKKMGEQEWSGCTAEIGSFHPELNGFDLLLIEAKRYNYNTFRSLLKWPGQKEKWDGNGVVALQKLDVIKNLELPLQPEMH
ncbi:hypothetical protein CEXT_197621 [Caerostris extrusa]|uniref:ERCC4 domain-containing protein n=1 Tax=Caerostris extrusa TaxID=172846 RepID=A0AAV4NV00_CAEEX|nr:hypothetical protein CEXT_197621 [Caerostris extrusa]